jgi:hypothetical protein
VISKQCRVHTLFLKLLIVDAWLKLHDRMVVIIPIFTKTIETCKKKFNLLFKQYMTNKLTSSISREEMHECKFYESIDQLWHQIGTIMKHVTTSTNEMELAQFENNNELLVK